MRMDRRAIEELLRDVRDGRLDVAAALQRLRDLPYEDMGFARIDHHRALRRGFPEVVFCPGKTPGQVAAIVARLAQGGATVLATRAGEPVAAAVQRACPGAVYNEVARLVAVGPRAAAILPPGATAAGAPDGAAPAGAAPRGRVAVLSAGTADQAVAEEAAATAAAAGCDVERLYDVGVSGLHRLLDVRPRLDRCDALVVVAGMDGALPSVVAGLTDRPVVAVPTSVGYGSSFGGLAALLAMLNSCASGVGVVNIDNGFGGGMLAATIARLAAGARGAPGDTHHGDADPAANTSS